MKLWFSVQAANKNQHEKDEFGFVPELRNGGYGQWLDNWDLPKSRSCGIFIDRALGVWKEPYSVGGGYYSNVVPFCKARPTIYDLFDVVDSRVMLFVGAPPERTSDEEFLYELQWGMKLRTVCYDTGVVENTVYDVLTDRGVRVLREPSWPGISESRLSTYDRAFPSEVVWMVQKDVNIRFKAAYDRLIQGLETVVAFRGLTKNHIAKLEALA